MMKKGITLIEILVVLIIISVIASFLLPAIHKARLRGLVVKTKATISAIEAALSMYETDFGDYPLSDGTGSETLYKLLQGPVESKNWKGPYIRFKKDDVDENGNILDAWKNPIFYKYPQNKYPNTPYIIFSAGKDGKIETEDDIGNW